MGARNMDDIAEFFQNLRFKKKMIGGVNERHVWKQMELLQSEYRCAYECQEERFKALLEERDAEINRLRVLLSEGAALEGKNGKTAREPPEEGYAHEQ